MNDKAIAAIHKIAFAIEANAALALANAPEPMTPTSQYLLLVERYTADHAAVETLTRLLAEMTRWASEYHREAERLAAELERVRGETTC